MKIAILGSSGHWRLALEGLAPGRPGLEWIVAPVGKDSTGSVSGETSPDAGEDMGPVLQALSAAYQPVRSYLEWREALDVERPDIAVLNPPFHLLGPLVRECLLRGIHVFAEKPLAIAQNDLDAIRTLTVTPGMPKLMAMLSMRYSSEYLAGYRFAASGGIGAPILLSAQKSYPLIGWDGKPRAAFYHRRPTYGGTIPWIGIHCIDLFRWFTASPFIEVTASHSTLGNSGHGEMEAIAAMAFKMASGALATAHLDFLLKRRDGPWGDDRLRVAGDRGILEIREGRAFAQTETEAFRELDKEPGPAMFNAFLDWVERETPMLLTTEDCLAAAEASLRARDAADQGRVLAV